MADEVRLLDAEEVAAMREDLDSEAPLRRVGMSWEPARIVHTLEHLQTEWHKLVAENIQQRRKLESLAEEEDRAGLLVRIRALEKEFDEEGDARMEALEDRDTWKAEAEDRRAEVERLREALEETVKAYQTQLKALASERDGLLLKLYPVRIPG